MLTGFVGVALVLRPTLEQRQLWYGLAGLLSGLLSALVYLQISALGRAGEPEERIVFYFSLGGIVVGLLSMVLLVGCVVLFVELVLRAGFVYILVCFVPLALAADVWQPMRGTAQRAIRLLGGVILAQPVIALCLAIGGAALGDPTTPATSATVVAAAGSGAGADLASTVGVLLTGTAVVVLACFAPFMLLKLFPVGDTTATSGAKAAAIAPVTGAVSAVTSVASGGTSAAAGAAVAAGSRSKGSGG